MTPQEAIKILKYTPVTLNRNEKTTTLEYNKMLNIAEVAIEKQISKKTTKREYVPNGTLVYGYCPECDSFTKNFFRYCRNCGQALDWSDTE